MIKETKIEIKQKDLNIILICYQLLIFIPAVISGMFFANKIFILFIFSFMFSWIVYIKYMNFISRMRDNGIIIKTIFPKW